MMSGVSRFSMARRPATHTHAHSSRLVLPFWSHTRTANYADALCAGRPSAELHQNKNKASLALRPSRTRFGTPPVCTRALCSDAAVGPARGVTSPPRTLSCARGFRRYSFIPDAFPRARVEHFLICSPRYALLFAP